MKNFFCYFNIRPDFNYKYDEAYVSFYRTENEDKVYEDIMKLFSDTTIKASQAVYGQVRIFILSSIFYTK